MSSQTPIDHTGIRLINILDYKIGYFPIPKVACTTVKRTLYKLENQRQFDAEKEQCSVHSYFFDKTKKEKYDLFEYAFVLIRDPVKRFLSAYSNRVTHHKELSIGFIKSGYPQLLNEIPYFDPGIGQFIDGLMDYLKIDTIRHHIEPISRSLTKFDLKQFTKVYRLEEMSELESDLSGLLGCNICFDRLQTGGRKIRLRDLSRQQLEFLIDYYGNDYELLDSYYPIDNVWNEWVGQGM